MIEQSIYFALGCIVTALAALGFTPLLWNRALRLTRRRLQLQVPLSMQEILAERDQLRAEFAVERVRMEQAMARIRATKAADMVEIGRRTVDAVALADQVAAMRRVEQAQMSEIQLLTRENAQIGAEAGAAKVALHGSHVLVDRLKRAVEDMSDEVRALRGDVGAKGAAVSRLEAELMEARRPQGERLGGWLKAAVATVTGLDVAAPVTVSDEAATPDPRETHGPQPPPRTADEFEAARDRENVVNLRESLQARAERDVERSANDALLTLRAENETLRGALAVARREAAAPFVDREADAALRDSIHALGLAVASMTRDAERQAIRQADRAEDDVADAEASSGLTQGKSPRPIEAN